jgi:hypothetical protein
MESGLGDFACRTEKDAPGYGRRRNWLLKTMIPLRETPQDPRDGRNGERCEVVLLLKTSGQESEVTVLRNGSWRGRIKMTETVAGTWTAR